jgi:hypothetical protein
VCESNQLSTQAEIFYRQKTNLLKAVELYKAAFQLNLTDGSKCLDALSAATMLMDTSSVIEFLGNSISIGISPASIKNLWQHLGNGLEYNYLISNVDTTAIINKYTANLDSFMIKQLDVLAENDQKYRGEENYEWALQRALDSLNWIELKAIVQKNGRLPNYEEIGLAGQENLKILFFHMDKEIMEWFIPYIIKCVNEDNSNLGRIVLYQLDRIGMSEGLVFTITSNYKIETLSIRTKMKNGYYCQSFGEWFDETSRIDNKVYETPIDPNLNINEVNEIRKLFCLDSIEEKRQRKPWVNVVTIGEFESLINE